MKQRFKSTGKQRWVDRARANDPDMADATLQEECIVEYQLDDGSWSAPETRWVDARSTVMVSALRYVNAKPSNILQQEFQVAYQNDDGTWTEPAPEWRDVPEVDLP
jgi:hypothetical protein